VSQSSFKIADLQGNTIHVCIKLLAEFVVWCGMTVFKMQYFVGNYDRVLH
jgi:hypothetical protein